MSKDQDTKSEVLETDVIEANTGEEDIIPDETDDGDRTNPHITPEGSQRSSSFSTNRSFFEQIGETIDHGADQRLVIETRSGRPLLDVSLAMGLTIGGLLALLTPFLAILLVIFSLFTKTTVNVFSTR
ncbi:MAG: DUF4342 domain-containing protein [Chloroflexota bacterium]